MADAKNLYCRRRDLSNEASVEQFFVARLLDDLSYADRQIKPKTSLQTLAVNLGRRKVNYKPDYALKVGRYIRCIIDAKAVNEDLDAFVGQCAGYCLNLNRAERENPTRYFLLTNGVTTRLYEWDQEQPLVELAFGDFAKSNPKYKQLRDLLAPDAFKKATAPAAIHRMRRKSIEEINAEFSWCHQFIYRKDNLSQAAAFEQFVKIVFLKLLSDREIHAKHPELATQNEVSVPVDEARFSKRWLEAREADHPNPLDATQFQALLSRLETEIQTGTRKRIFEQADHIGLSPETIKGVVERLENTDLFGLDADLNGRLFETFLNATMRGKDLGQYFTPRSVVKLAVRLARLRAGRDHFDTVVDACCGTGGFLIDALADLWDKIDANPTLTDVERDEMRKTVATGRVYGIDAAKDPPLARIARMNMYLHGDGGSSIYQLDSLDKGLTVGGGETPEVRRERAEFKKRLDEGPFFDVVLTNPPFAKEYERRFERDAKILDEYEVGFDEVGGKSRARPAVRSSVLFLERYYDLLKPGGQLITVIDDSLLGGRKWGYVRDYIRSKFIVRAVVSLPGDAFQRSKARVKTSLIVLEKKRTPDEVQGAVFMHYCTVVGIDDPSRQRVLPIDKVNRRLAAQEIDAVGAAYDAFLAGESKAKKWTVPASRIKDRMDVKYCLPSPARRVPAWKKQGVEVKPLRDLVEVVFARGEEGDEGPAVESNDSRIIVTADSDEIVRSLRVTYEGFVEVDKEGPASETTHSRLFVVHEGDIIVSHINAVNGAIGVVPKELAGGVVTSEYTVARAKEGVDRRVLWMLLRSPEERADLLLLATGIGRSRVRWETASDLNVPLPDKPTSQKVVKALASAEAKEREARKLREQAQKELEDALGLDTTEARRLLAAFKPPR